MPPMMRDSVKLLRKGGRVKVVFPPAAVESTRETNKQNIVVIYTISVVNVNNP
jgi:FKBP-type peptidyl-prolyl cis-trans isomerase FkpA